MIMTLLSTLQQAELTSDDTEKNSKNKKDIM